MIKFSRYIRLIKNKLVSYKYLTGKTIPVHTPQGKPLNALIIDTEGIGATNEEKNHDNKIMTLANLLSCYFIFNFMGTIDESSIKIYFTNTWKLIIISSWRLKSSNSNWFRFINIFIICQIQYIQIFERAFS